MRDAYLVLYDYDTGGVWSYLRADSPEAILRRFPMLRIYDSPPEWMTEADRLEIERGSTYDLETAARDDPAFFGRLAAHEKPPT